MIKARAIVMSRHDVEEAIRKRLAKLRRDPNPNDVEDLGELLEAYMLFVDRDPDAPERIPMTVHNEAANVSRNGSGNGNWSAGFVLGGLIMGLVIALLILVIVHLVSELKAIGKDPFVIGSSSYSDTPFRSDIRKHNGQLSDLSERERDEIVLRTVVGIADEAEARQLTKPPARLLPNGMDDRRQMHKHRDAWARLKALQEGAARVSDGDPIPQ